MAFDVSLRDGGSGTFDVSLSTPPGGSIAPVVMYYRRKRGQKVQLLKQSTSVDVPIGPFVDATDAVTAETALTITQPDIRLKKGAAAWAQKAAAQTLSHEENGWYEVTLDATDTGTLGKLMLAVHEAGALPVWHEFLIVPANIYDSLVDGSDTLDVAVTSIAANAITAAAIAADAITDAKVASDVTIASVTGAVGSVTGNVGGNVVGSVASVTAGVTVTTNNDKTGYGLSGAAVQAIWDALTSALTTVGSIGKKLADWTIGTAQTGDSFARLGAPAGASVSADIAAVKAETAAILADTSVIGATGEGLTTLATQASVNTVDDFLDTEIAAILADTNELQTDWVNGGRLDLLIDAIKAVTDKLDTALELDGAVYRYTTNALEQGPAGGGGGGLDAAGVRAAVGLASANLDAQLGAIDDFMDTEIAAIKAKTDNLPAAPAAAGDIPTAQAIATEVWSEPVPGAFTNGTAGEVLGSLLSDLGAATVEIVSPVLSGGDTIEIVAGDSYLTADGRSIVWTLVNPPNLTGATVTFHLPNFSKVATVSGGVTVTLELTDDETASIGRGQFTYSLIAEFNNGSIQSLLLGAVLIA